MTGSTSTAPDLLDLVDGVVARARDGEDVEAVAVRRRDTDIRAYEGEVEQLSSAETHGVGVRVVRDGRQGYAWCGTFDPDALAETLDDARDNAEFSTPDDAQAIAAPDGVAPVDLDLWRDDAVAVTTEQKVDLALELERATRAADPRITGIESADYGDGFVESAISTTTGVRGAERVTMVSAVVYALAADGEATRTGYSYGVGRTLGDLDVDTIATEAAERTVAMIGATKPATGRSAIVLDQHVTSAFLGLIASTLSGEAVLKQRSPFADRVGEQIGASIVSLVEDPTDPAAPGATPIDGEGIATRRVPLLEGGVLCGFLHNSYTARRLGGSTTGSAVRDFKTTPGVGCRAVSLVPGEGDAESLARLVGDGVLVTAVIGLHSGVNPVSGDFSTGAEGRRIRGGELGEPINEFTVGSTLQKMLHDVIAVGGDLRWFGGRAAGLSLAIGDATISGT
jgi:PmbA protein